jgi:hypothetical protein
MFIINLALSDLIFSAVNGFPLLTISAFYRKWMWGDTGNNGCWDLMNKMYDMASLCTNSHELIFVREDRNIHLAYCWIYGKWKRKIW